MIVDTTFELARYLYAIAHDCNIEDIEMNSQDGELIKRMSYVITYGKIPAN